MRYIITLLFCFGSRACNPGTGRRTSPVMIPNAFTFLIEVLFYLVQRSPRLRFSFLVFTAPVFVPTRLIVRNEIDFCDKLAFNEDVGVLVAESHFYSPHQ